MPATQQPSARELLRAIEQNELRLHYQPIVSLQAPDLRVCGYEALVRWQHPDRGLLFPGAFLPSMTQVKITDFKWQKPLFDWVFQEACQTARTLKDGLYVAVNLSPLQLTSHDFFLQVKESLLKWEITGRVRFEITEDAIAARDLAILQNALLPLSEWAPLGIDDFGTSGSSLWRLTNLQEIISFLKIDRAFMPRSEFDVKAIAIYRCLWT
jgi:EAL domain-containing protein (putative c-di-GMP-specific phosphodiesterase class I)